MRFKEIAIKVKNDEITFDYCGHDTYDTKENFISNFEHLVEYANGAGDGKWSIRPNENMEETNLSMRNFYQQRIDAEIEENKSIMSIEPEHCSGCGYRLRWVLNGNKLTLREFYNDKIKIPGKKWLGSFDHFPIEYRCPYEKLKPFCGKIKVSSRLILLNFFKGVEDTPKGKKYTREWSLNDLIGRHNITKYKSKKNIAYGQMSNMSIGIYVNENRDCVIVGPAYHPAEVEEYDSDEEYEIAISKPVFDGFNIVGTMSLRVWRWEATDLETIGDYNQFIQDHEDQEIIEIDVKHGVWEFKHYFDRIEEYENENNHCYSKFTLKQS